MSDLALNVFENVQHLIYTLLFFGGRQPLCGNGVMSLIITTSIPEFANARIEPSRPAPGPFTYTSTLLTLHRKLFSQHRMHAICAAYGVFFLEPLKPILPALLQEITWPVLLVILMIKIVEAGIDVSITISVNLYYSFLCRRFCALSLCFCHN